MLQWEHSQEEVPPALTNGHQILCNVHGTEWTTTGHHLSLLDMPDIDKDNEWHHLNSLFTTWLLSSRAKNSISEDDYGLEICKSGMKSGCLELEWVGVGGTWLQLMCCTALHRCVPNFGRQGLGWRLEIGVGDDFVVKDKGWSRTTRRRIQVVEQEEDLRD